MKQQQTVTESGMVLLEAIVAVGVLVTMFAATMALFTRSVTGINISSEQLVAIYLAQDAMEQVVAKNEFNKGNFLPWLTGMSSCRPGPCAIDYYVATDMSADPVSCSAASVNGCVLYFDGTVYTTTDVGGGEWSQFTREVEIVQSTTYEADVDVTVSWQSGENTMSYVLHYILYEYEL